MVSLNAKYNLRNDLLRWSYQVVTPIMWVMILMGIRFARFAKYGFAVYGGKSDQLVTVPGAMDYFLDHSIWPLVPWALAMIPVDIFIVRPLYRKYVLN